MALWGTPSTARVSALSSPHSRPTPVTCPRLRVHWPGRGPSQRCVPSRSRERLPRGHKQARVLPAVATLTACSWRSAATSAQSSGHWPGGGYGLLLAWSIGVWRQQTQAHRLGSRPWCCAAQLKADVSDTELSTPRIAFSTPLP